MDLKPSLFAEFPPVTEEAWRERVAEQLGELSLEHALISKRRDGLRIEPLYTGKDHQPDGAGFPGRSPFVRGFGSRTTSRLAAEYTLSPVKGRPELVDLAREVERGVEVLWLRVSDWQGAPVDALEDGLRGVDPTQTSVMIEAGARVLPWASAYLAWLDRHDIDPAQIDGGVFGDPCSAWASSGTLPGALERVYDSLFVWTRKVTHRSWPLLSLQVEVATYREAGATAVQELALAVATAAELLRRASDQGLDPKLVARQLHFTWGVGADLFTEIAKLRAGRWLWAKMAQASGLTDEDALVHFHVRGLNANRTACDPYGNLLRGTAETFAALTGGADSIATLPYDRALAEAGDAGRRLAIKTQHVLRQEGYLERVTDPAGGSWHVEALTEKLARAAWDLFREIEAEGGLIEELKRGGIDHRLQASVEESRKAFASRRDVMVSVNDFAFLGETLTPAQKSSVASTETEQTTELLELGLHEEDGDVLAQLESVFAKGADLRAVEKALWQEQGPTIEPLKSFRPAELFEELRLAAARYESEKGVGPRVFIANWGQPSDYRARAEYSTRFLAIGGLEAVDAGGFEDLDALLVSCAEAACKVAVICSTDELYAETVPKMASALKAQGIRVVLAGRPGDSEAAYREAGVDAFIHIGCDAVAVLRQILMSIAQPT